MLVWRTSSVSVICWLDVDDYDEEGKCQPQVAIDTLVTGVTGH